jgi:hypothetical protein
MSDTSVHRVPETIATVVRFHVGHYVTAVALDLLERGVPVHQVTATGPATFTLDEEAPEEFRDASGGIAFNRAYATALKGPDCRLEWTADSGWMLHPNFDIEEPEDGGEPDCYVDVRWLAGGLTPPPEHVTQFLMSAHENWDGTGSAIRPSYRHPTDGYGHLLEQLTAYLPGPEPRLHFEDWQARFADAQDDAYFWRAIDELTVDGPDPVLDVPLRNSEARALLRLLDLLQAKATLRTTDLVAAVAADVAARIDGGRETADTGRTARDLAVRAPAWWRRS